MPITEGGNFTPDNRIVSPGVFTREIDQSGVAQGVADIGGVVVAPFAKGPGFAPTLVNSVADLQQQFGIADGTLYGPYTAQQYLQEKGFVTVCRVGALTGYKQNYPWVVWAENGVWVRQTETASFASGSTISQAAAVYSASILQSGVVWRTSGVGFSQYSSSIAVVNVSTAVTMSITTSFIGTPGTPFRSAVTSSVVPDSVVPNLTQSIINYYYDPSYTGSVVISQSATLDISGSTLYNGDVIAGTVYGALNLSVGLNLATASATSASILSAIESAGYFLGYLTAPRVLSTEVPFDTIQLLSSASVVQLAVSQSIDACFAVTLNVYGTFAAQMGKYTGEFRSGSLVYDPCSGEWVSDGSTQYKVLAVLADTQFGGISNLLQAPGFLGSTQSYNPVVSASSTITPSFDLVLSQSADGGYGIYRFSLDPSSIQYITNVFGDNPRAGNPAQYAAGTKKEAAYLYKIFEDDIAVVAGNASGWRINGSAMPNTQWPNEPLNFTDQYSLDLTAGDSAFGLTNAYTPWIVSQKISPWNGGTSTRFPLFRILTLADGTDTNTAFKIEISNVKLAGTVAGSDWGTFTVTVRDYSDTDKKPVIIEQFNNCNLDSTSPNFVARKIGDRYNFIRYDGKIIEFGTYDNLSKNIRVEMATNPWPITAVPYGFQEYSAPVNGTVGRWCNPMAFSKASVYGLFPGKYPSGVDFGGPPAGADAQLTALYPTSSATTEHWRDNLQYFAPVPSGATVGGNSIFALDEEITANGVTTGSSAALGSSNVVPAVFDATNETTYVKMRKFVFGFQGGFSGQSPAITLNIGGDITAGNTQGLNCANSTAAGSIAYAQCIAALGNADEFDINLIVTPGIIYSLHSYVTNLVVEMCETRGDCFYILDLYEDDGNPTSGQIDEVVGLAGEFDTNYAGTYYPWVKIKDTNTNQIVTVPPSVVMPAVYAANDRVAGEWWAAAGLNRGGITQAVQVTDRTTHVERDTLYEGKVNPIAAFPGQGIVAWGQKTLQDANTALNRINVRRLLIEIKKFFASTARFIVFEQNTATTRNKFLAIVNPYLESVQQRSGLYAFQVVMDESNNTPDLIDQNILYGQIFLQPTKTAEFIVLDFNIMPTGASFQNA